MFPHKWNLSRQSEQERNRGTNRDQEKVCGEKSGNMFKVHLM